MSKSVLRYSDGCALHTPEERADHWPYPLYWPKDEKARAKWRESYLDLPPEKARDEKARDEKARDKMIALLSGKAPDENDETEERHDEEDGLPPDEVARRAMIRRSNATG